MVVLNKGKAEAILLLGFYNYWMRLQHFLGDCRRGLGKFFVFEYLFYF